MSKLFNSQCLYLNSLLYQHFYKTLSNTHRGSLCLCGSSSLHTSVVTEKYLKKPTTKSMYVYTKRFLDGGMIDKKTTWLNPSKSIKLGLKGQNQRTSGRRIIALNSLFLTAIVHCIESGEVGTMLLGRKLNITKVRVLEDMVGIQVFYIVGDVEKNIEQPPIEDLLKQAAPLLRQELVNQKITSSVPCIYFKPDEELEQIRTMNELIKRLREKEGWSETAAGSSYDKQQQVLAPPPVPDYLFAEDYVFDKQELPPLTPPHKGKPKKWRVSVSDEGELEKVLNGEEEEEDADHEAEATYPRQLFKPMSNVRVVPLTTSTLGFNQPYAIAKITSMLRRTRGMVSSYPFSIDYSAPYAEYRGPQGLQSEERIEYTSKDDLRKWAHSYARSTIKTDRSLKVREKEGHVIAGMTYYRDRERDLVKEEQNYQALENELKDLDDYWDDQYQQLDVEEHQPSEQ